MDTKLQIKITEGIGWYEDKVGEVFDVDSVENYDDGTVFHIDPPSHAKYFDGRRFVREEDCEVVSEDTPDAVSHPSHYTQGGIEVIDIIAQTVAGYEDPFVAHCVGTSTKYLNRAPYKHESPLEDLEKAREYLTFAIDHINEKLTKEGE